MLLDNIGEVMVGVTYGLQYGLLAMGLVLVWRASRFVNFAHGQMGVPGSGRPPDGDGLLGEGLAELLRRRAAATANGLGRCGSGHC